MEKKKLINWLGLTGVLSLLSYTLAVVIAPSAFPGYDWMSQAVSDLSAETAPSRMLWEQLAAGHSVLTLVCMAVVCVFVSERKVGTKLFRVGVYLFGVMSTISGLGYKMFPLTDSGKEIETFQEIMHMVVTVPVVLLSIVSLILLIVAGCKEKKLRGIGVLAAVALAMMFVGAIGQAVVPQDYFGIVERCSVFAAVGFTAVLGLYLFGGFKKAHEVAA